MSRPFLILFSFAVGCVCGFALIPLASPAETKQQGKLGREVALLREENDRLRLIVADAERAKKLAAGRKHSDQIEQDVAEIRGLSFDTPVDYNVLDRQQIKKTIGGKLDEVYSPQEFIDMTHGLAALGLLEPGYALRQSYIDLLGEQVAAFYDQHQHKLFMFEDATLDNAQNRIVLAHELTHALQDQHFSLKKLPLEAKDNDDRSAAAAALVEGDATLVMSEYMLKNMSLTSLKDTLTTSVTQNMDQLAKAPRFLREMLIFPYLRGQEFCGALYGRGGYDAISKAYATPPTSTSQILHPEKFLSDPREEPIAVSFGDTTALGQKPIAENTVGEMGVRILISQWVNDATGEKAGTGWRGDRYLCYDAGRALAWKTVWANAEEASEFFDAERAALEKRHGLTGGRAEPGRYAAESPRFVRILTPRPEEVLVIDAATAEWADALVKQFGN